MKKLYTFLLIAFTVVVGNAQIVNIPDANFKAKLLSATASNGFNYIAQNAAGNAMTIDNNSDGQIDVSEATLVYRLNVSSSNINDLTGIENFINLKTLFCGLNSLTNLNISTLPNLQSLHCSNNQLMTLGLSNMPNLNVLRCSSNNLTSLSLVSFPNLIDIFCDFNNNLSALNLVNLPSLQQLGCNNCSLSSLNVNGINNLRGLSCANNNLASLDVSNLTFLNSLNCGLNNISILNVSNLINLRSLAFSYNQVQTIDVSNLPNLSTLICRNNNISSFYLKNGYNYSLATNDHFSTYTITGNPVVYICADDNKIPSLTNYFSSLSPNINSYCSFVPGGTYYTIEGKTKLDINNNGCDAVDINFPNLKSIINSGSNVIGAFISDNSGDYSIPFQAGTYTINPIIENTTYFTVSPATATVTFPTATSPFIQDFCVTPNGVHNDLEVIVLPITSARPGFDATYKIIYKNKGTGVQSGSVNLAFDDTKIDLVASSPLINSATTNNLNWTFSNLQPFETKEIFVVMNINSPMETPVVNGGDVLPYTATVVGASDETPTDNISTLNQTVVNSFDPNDKTCLEGATVSPSMVGKYVHYVIRFENTGTADAQNIVVKDIIDTTKYDIGSLIPLSSSASYVTRINNTNQLEFIFENINLPFADATNDGYVAFKIKTKPTLVVGDTFSNMASIYFDYNFPIITDPAITTITALGIPEFEFSNVFILSPMPAKDVLTITTKQAVAISSISIYNMLGQLVQVLTNPNETIDVSNLKTGSYFIKIVSNRGTASISFSKA